MPMDLFRENAELTQDFHPRVEGKPLPMDLFRHLTLIVFSKHKMQLKSKMPLPHKNRM
ncbi:hypothetical protein GsuE55_33660 [Geobacillus subterraneus]|uniref:Uncharacterized protein n=1 Tax=Geobacillus subterraneus TaxID=129338 RepID=A0A679FR06_9BACL|nr:hypothetical protein GsuE55_33660 [Geobacillus subterraneus]